VLWTGEPPRAVAIFMVTKQASEQQDFAQRPFHVPSMTVVVKAFAARDAESAHKVASALVSKAKGHPVLFEIFEEDDIAKAAVLASGLRYAGTKISAGSEIKGLYTHGFKAPLLAEQAPEDTVTLAVLDRVFLSAQALAEINGELDAYGEEAFAQHYSDYNKRKSWTSFALRGYSDEPGDIVKPAEMSKAWKEAHPAALKERPRWTRASAQFPSTLSALGQLGELEFDRVRFMRLRAKDGELSRHADITDREAGTANGFVSRLHVPIRTSPAVTFYGWGARGNKLERNLPQGALCYLDQRKPHAVRNTDPTVDRVHLVIDCFANERVRDLIRAAA
jgi:hypothetical protein